MGRERKKTNKKQTNTKKQSNKKQKSRMKAGDEFPENQKPEATPAAAAPAPAIEEAVQAPSVEEPAAPVEEVAPTVAPVEEAAPAPAVEEAAPAVEEAAPAVEEAAPVEEPVYEPEPESIQPQPQSKSRWPFIIAILMTFIAFIPLGFGFYTLFHPTNFTGQTTAKVSNVSCQSGSHVCNIEITYNVNNTDYIQKNITTNTIYAIGQNIAIHYDTNNPNNFTIDEASWKNPVIGSSLIILAFIIIIASWMYYLYQ